MTEYFHKIEQGTDEWRRVRMGILTASCVNQLITPTGKVAKGEKVLAFAQELAAQRITGRIEETYTSMDMQRGHMQEAIARDIYSESFAPVQECGFMVEDFDGFQIGASPDGLVGDVGGVEIKSRRQKFQIETIVKGEVPEEYMNQIQTCLLVSGRSWWDFIQYSNGMPFFVKRVFPDASRQATILEAAKALEDVIRGIVSKYIQESQKLIETEWVEILTDEIEGSDNNE